MSLFNIDGHLILNSNFNTGEVETGATWLNGEKIYAQAFHFTNSDFTRSTSGSRVNYESSLKIINSTKAVKIIAAVGSFLTLYSLSGTYINRKITLNSASMNTDGTVQILSMFNYHDKDLGFHVYFQHHSQMQFYNPAVREAEILVFYTY